MRGTRCLKEVVGEIRLTNVMSQSVWISTSGQFAESDWIHSSESTESDDGRAHCLDQSFTQECIMDVFSEG